MNYKNRRLHYKSYIFQKTRMKNVIRNDYRQKIKFNSYCQI